MHGLSGVAGGPKGHLIYRGGGQLRGGHRHVACHLGDLQGQWFCPSLEPSPLLSQLPVLRGGVVWNLHKPASPDFYRQGPQMNYQCVPSNAGYEDRVSAVQRQNAGVEGITFLEAHPVV